MEGQARGLASVGGQWPGPSRRQLLSIQSNMGDGYLFMYSFKLRSGGNCRTFRTAPEDAAIRSAVNLFHRLGYPLEYTRSAVRLLMDQPSTNILYSAWVSAFWPRVAHVAD